MRPALESNPQPFKKVIYLILERGEGREKEKERNINLWLPLTSLGTWPAIQACALSGNHTCDPLVCRPTLNPLRHTSQGWMVLVVGDGGRNNCTGAKNRDVRAGNT